MSKSSDPNGKRKRHRGDSKSSIEPENGLRDVAEGEKKSRKLRARPISALIGVNYLSKSEVNSDLREIQRVMRDHVFATPKGTSGSGVHALEEGDNDSISPWIKYGNKMSYFPDAKLRNADFDVNSLKYCAQHVAIDYNYDVSKAGIEEFAHFEFRNHLMGLYKLLTEDDKIRDEDFATLIQGICSICDIAIGDFGTENLINAIIHCATRKLSKILDSKHENTCMSLPLMDSNTISLTPDKPFHDAKFKRDEGNFVLNAENLQRFQMCCTESQRIHDFQDSNSRKINVIQVYPASLVQRWRAITENSHIRQAASSAVHKMATQLRAENMPLNSNESTINASEPELLGNMFRVESRTASEHTSDSKWPWFGHGLSQESTLSSQPECIWLDTRHSEINLSNQEEKDKQELDEVLCKLEDVNFKINIVKENQIEAVKKLHDMRCKVDEVILEIAKVRQEILDIKRRK